MKTARVYLTSLNNVMKNQRYHSCVMTPLTAVGVIRLVIGTVIDGIRSVLSVAISI